MSMPDTAAAPRARGEAAVGAKDDIGVIEVCGPPPGLSSRLNSLQAGRIPLSAVIFGGAVRTLEARMAVARTNIPFVAAKKLFALFAQPFSC